MKNFYQGRFEVPNYKYEQKLTSIRSYAMNYLQMSSAKSLKFELSLQSPSASLRKSDMNLSYLSFLLLAAFFHFDLKADGYEITANRFRGSGSAASAGVARLLTGKPHQMISDSFGRHFEVYYVERDPLLQGLIDDLTIRLLKTSTGAQICSELLDSNPNLIIQHLGVSSDVAQTLARNCWTPFRGTNSRFVVANGLVGDSSKSSLNYSPRKYTIVVTDQPQVPVDSWTDSLSNRTTLFLSRTTRSSGSDINWQHLLQILSHEMAIYFDAKSWAWGPEWSLLPRGLNRAAIAESEASERIQLATLNPMINTVLAFVRAYKIERLMLREAYEAGKLGPEAPFYGQPEFPFLANNCETECLSRFIRSQSEWLRALSPALVGYFPHYRSRRLLWSQRHPSLSSGEFDSLKFGLETLPTRYMTTLIERRNSAFDLVSTLFTPFRQTPFKKVAEVLVDRLLPEDLTILEGAHVRLNENSSTIGVLPFLAVPLLSDVNTQLSSGPRPRIRTGGTE